MSNTSIGSASRFVSATSSDQNPERGSVPRVSYTTQTEDNQEPSLTDVGDDLLSFLKTVELGNSQWNGIAAVLGDSDRQKH